MDIKNKRLTFDDQEAPAVVDALSYTLLDHLKVMNARVFHRAKEDEKLKQTVLVYIARMRTLALIVDEINQKGWPKGCHFKCPTGEDFIRYMKAKNDVELYKYFERAAFAEEKKSQPTPPPTAAPKEPAPKKGKKQ